MEISLLTFLLILLIGLGGYPAWHKITGKMPKFIPSVLIITGLVYLVAWTDPGKYFL